ncbi:MAG: TrmH family RNA methyltransferase [Bacteroidota bacterium]
MASERRIKKIRYVLRHRQPGLTVVVENVHDPHNVSAILRSCDATGVMEVQLVYTEEEFPAIGKKSSASANKWVGRRTFATVEECYRKLQEEGYRIYATRLGPKSKSLYELDLTKPVALVFGNEHRGVSHEAAELADGNFQIPMFGMIQSLNVSVACAVSLFEALRQRTVKVRHKKPKLSARRLRTLLKEWTVK